MLGSLGLSRIVRPPFSLSSLSLAPLWEARGRRQSGYLRARGSARISIALDAGLMLCKGTQKPPRALF
eukprot:7467276-Pyramimonas_sp.AAC.1